MIDLEKVQDAALESAARLFLDRDEKQNNGYAEMYKPVIAYVNALLSEYHSSLQSALAEHGIEI